jgi:hypothetical protein
VIEKTKRVEVVRAYNHRFRYQCDEHSDLPQLRDNGEATTGGWSLCVLWETVAL